MRYCLKHRIDHDVIEGCPRCLIRKVTEVEVNLSDENRRDKQFVEDLLTLILEYEADKGI